MGLCVETKMRRVGLWVRVLALHFERIWVVGLCVSTKMRRFGLWVCVLITTF